ncbi:helix-turn-helix transcriptional regulator [Streptomyces sp. 549]|uniref:helix-turn-helix domain-containing protein n=1 Tax=Streptomyces sp. 549 TaxID=3049076 RepID=UPI0024C21C7B|nr:helix-turn-helix transcriptional regulator [Streptomyces sp. 549]MDK1472112.1 helix-turn-helix transcriptional regulator [Streptomyces sp. 549]
MTVGSLLRGWRQRAGISQLELALRADSSARHLSFVETGRARPGRDLLLRLAGHLDVPVRERNALLLAAGYAPHYPQTPLDDPAMDGLRDGLERMVAGHEPHPAVVLDGTYTVVAANRAVSLLLDGVDPQLLTPPLNAMRLTLHPRGMAPRIRNHRQWRGHLLSQMERQLALVRHPPLAALYEEVAGYPPPPGLPRDEPAGERAAFALPLLLDHDGRTLSFLSTVATFNTPADVTVSELAVETFLPADRATADVLHARAAERDG